MAAYLRGIAASIGQRPTAILVISGHWEEAQPTVHVGRNPPLLFDYYGFPEHTYRLSYPAPGSPELAKRVRDLLAAAGIDSGEEAERGLDHGVFVPFLLVYPEADIPVVQLSLRQDLDPAAHLAIGRALAPLRDEGVLIVGSGMSFHNLRAFGSTDPRVIEAAQRFDDWLAGGGRGTGRSRAVARAGILVGSARCAVLPPARGASGAAVRGRRGRARRPRAADLQRSHHRQGRLRLPVRLSAVNHESANFAVGNSRG